MRTCWMCEVEWLITRQSRLDSQIQETKMEIEKQTSSKCEFEDENIVLPPKLKFKYERKARDPKTQNWNKN